MRYLMQVGQKVRVCCLRDRVSPQIAAKLGQMGTIKGFCLVDGSDIGLIVEFEGQFTTHFFANELEVVHPVRLNPSSSLI